MRARLWIGSLWFCLVFAPLCVAQDMGTVGPAGQAITPSEEGALLVLKPKAPNLPVYTLVRACGKAVVIMTPTGDALTPRQAWETYGGQAKAPTVLPRAHPSGSFSVPNAHR